MLLFIVNRFYFVMLFASGERQRRDRGQKETKEEERDSHAELSIP